MSEADELSEMAESSPEDRAEVIEALSTSRVLCMTYIEGTKILAVKRTWSDPKRIARIGLMYGLRKGEGLPA